MMNSLPMVCLSGAWLVEVAEQSVVIWRPCDGSRIEFEDLDVSAFTTFWDRLQDPCGPDTVASLLKAFGSDAGDFHTLLEEQGVLRRPRRPLAIQRTTAAELLNAELETHGASDLVVFAVEDCLVAARGCCPQCLVLRTLGVVGVPREEQTTRLDTRLEEPHVAAMLAASLDELEQQPLTAGEALLARFEGGIDRGAILPHGDCRCCDATGARRMSVDALREHLQYDDAPPATAQGISARLGASPFAPIVMTEAQGPPGTFPFDLPFMTGHTRLTRRVGERLFCTSIAAIAHGSAATLEQTRLLAWSEGAERIAAQSVVADSVAVLEEAGQPQACCHAWDLINEGAQLVPIERVAVAVPDAIGRVAEETFTGTASHTTCLAAVLHATVEVLKREAFMIAWYRKRRLCRLSWPDELEGPAATRMRYLQSHGLELSVYDLRTDVGIPILLLRVRATRRIGNWPAGGTLLLPAGGFTPYDALSHALGLACTRFAGWGLDSAPEKNPLNAAAVAMMANEIPAWPSMIRYLDPLRAPELNWLYSEATLEFEAIGGPGPPSARQRFYHLREKLRAVGMRWLCVPLTTPPIRSCGLHVVKVVLPEAVRFVLHQDQVHKEHPRMSLPWLGTTPGSWNEDPHPLY